MGTKKQKREMKYPVSWANGVKHHQNLTIYNYLFE